MTTWLLKLLGLLALLGLLLLAGLVIGHWATIPATIDPEDLPSSLLAPPAAEFLEAVEEGRTLSRALVSEDRLPGLSIAVAVDGEIVWAEGFGRADLETREPVTPATRFRIGGITRALTAVAAGLLQDRGRLDLDAPVQRYVPSFPEKEWPVSTRDLMAETAGIRPAAGESGIFLGRSCQDDSERVAVFSADPLRFRPGTRREHSTHGWALVGAAIAGAAGEPYLGFVEREILAPLGMASTAPDRPGAIEAASAHFYYPRLMLDPRLGVHDAPNLDLSCHLPAAGFLSTPSDLVRFGSAILAGRLLEPATLEALQRPTRLSSRELTGHSLGLAIAGVPLGSDGRITRIAGQGLGEAVLRRPLSATSGEGQVAGSTATLLLVPEHGLSVALASNVSGAARVAPLALRVADAFVRALEAR